MNKFLLGWAFAGVVLTLGCSKWFGIHHAAQLDSTPDLDCIESVLKKDDHVNAVGLRHLGGSRTLTWRGLGPPDSVPTFTYHYDGRECMLWIRIREGDSVEFHHGASAARDAPASELRAIRNQLTSIETSLEANCDMREFRSRMKERCYGKHCDEIESNAA